MIWFGTFVLPFWAAEPFAPREKKRTLKEITIDRFVITPSMHPK